MSDIEAEALAKTAVRTGVVTREEAREAKLDAEDGSVDALIRSFESKGLLTSWQIDKLRKGDDSGYFHGGCKVLFHIAEGTFARVYRGTRVFGGGEPVAIKVLRHRFAENPAHVQRFVAEAEAGMRLIHPNIVRIFEHGEDQKNYYMIMEYVEGANLRDFLRLRKKLSPAEALPIMLGLSEALAYAMTFGIAHRDIKNTNILISNQGQAKLVDFGLATLATDDRQIAASGQRTVDYSALERTCGSPKGDPRSDIFFLGCVFYQLLSGQPALPEAESKDPLAKMLKRGISTIRPLAEIAPEIDPGLTRIVDTMMKVDLSRRFQSMEQAHRELEAYKKAKEAPAEEFEFEDPFARPATPPPAPAKDHHEPSFVDDSDEFFEIHKIFETPAFQHKQLLCVEAQEEIREAFRRTFQKMGYRVLLLGDPEHAAERYQEKATDAIVFDADGLGSGSIEHFLTMVEHAREERRDLNALLLLGPRQKALADRLPADQRIVVISKPVKMRQIQETVAKLCPAHPAP